MQLKGLVWGTEATIEFETVDPNLFEIVTGIGKSDAEVVAEVWSLTSSAGLTVSTSAIQAALYQDDDAHDTCSLTACLNPLHPGPCKGWKHTLHSTSPGAWHALEAARVEKANATRVKKIEALKAQGKPIPHKLLQPILPKSHPDAGKTASNAAGEAHKAGQEVSANAGVHVNEPGKVTLGQAIKAMGPVAKGPKGKKPTLASHGIAFVIGQEKVTPQYKLDKAAAITPEQWNALSEADKSVIRGELAKISIDGFGKQQEKANELLAKLPAGAPVKAQSAPTIKEHAAELLAKAKAKTKASEIATPKPELTEAQKVANDAFGIYSHLKPTDKQLAAASALTSEEFHGLPEATQKEIKKTLISLHTYNPDLRKRVGTAMAKFTTGDVQKTWQKEADHPGYTPAMVSAGKFLLESGSLGKGKAQTQERLDAYKKLTPEDFHNLNPKEQAFVLHELSAMGKGKNPKIDAKLANDLHAKLSGTKAEPTKLSEIATPTTAVTTGGKPTLTATHNGHTYEKNTGVDYTHMSVTKVPGTDKPMISWHKSEAAAAKGNLTPEQKKNGMHVIAVVPVTKHAEEMKAAEAPKTPAAKLGDLAAPTSMTPSKLAAEIKKNGPTDVTIKGVKHKVAFTGSDKHAELIQVTGIGGGTGHYVIKTPGGEKIHLGKGEPVTVHPHEPKAPEAPKVPEVKAADIKPLPKHVTDAIAMAEGKAPGASWSKNHLAAYQPLSAEEFQALPKDTQAKIISELEKGQSKFLDPKKIAAAKALVEKFKGGANTKADLPSAKVVGKDIGFSKDLHNHDITAAEAKKVVEATPMSAHYLNAKQTAGLTGPDNPDAIAYHTLNAEDDAKALVAKHTQAASPEVLKQPSVKTAVDNLKTAAMKQSFAQSVQNSKVQAFNKITFKLSKDKAGLPGEKLSPIEKASLLHYQQHLETHQVPPTDMASMDKLKADTKAAENQLTDALHAATKNTNAPSPDSMSETQITDRAKELLGAEAIPNIGLNLGEKQLKQQDGESLAKAEAKKFPPEVLSDPSVAAKLSNLADAHANLLITEAMQDKLNAHITNVHQAAILNGVDQHGNPLTQADKQIIAKHAIQVGSKQGGYLGKLATSEQKAVDDATAAFTTAAEKAAPVAPPELVHLSEYDVNTVHDAYRSAWGKTASKAVLYGANTWAVKSQMKNNPQYEGFTKDLGNLQELAGKLAVAHAQEHTAELNVPTDPDTGAKLDGPEKSAWAADTIQRAALEKQFNDLHKVAQAKLDTIRTEVGLKKRALPKIDSPAVKAMAAESAYYKTGSYSGPLYGKSHTAKHYLLAKAGPKIAVAHQTPSEKKLAKLGDVAGPKATTTKIENLPKSEPVKLGGGDSSIAHIPDALKKQITSDFKAMPSGKYLADPAEDIFDNLVNLAAAHAKSLSKTVETGPRAGHVIPGELSVDQVLKTIDETHSKNLGVANSGMLQKKITDWLGTATGKAYAETHSTPNPKAVKQISGELDLPEGVTLAPGEKVQKLAGPGPHDESLSPKDFHALTAAQVQAAQDAHMKAEGIKWSPQVKASIKSYTGSAYQTYNDFLRSGSSSGSQATKQAVINIQSAMMPLQSNLLLKRGTGWPPELAAFKSDPHKLLGKTFEDKGFVSSTPAGSSGHFSGMPLQLVIEAPKGTPAAFVNSISHFKDKENEMILAAGTKFKVLSVEATTGGHTVVRVRVVGDK